MNSKANYESWPKMVKITTALSNKRVLIKSPTILYVLGYLLVICGIFGIGDGFYKSEIFTTNSILPSLSFTLIGIVNIIGGNSIKWITENSSWEERFEYKSSLVNKGINILISLMLVACLVVIFKQ